MEDLVPFDHEKLDVYKLAIEFVATAADLVEPFPRGRGYLVDQIQRAALSIVLNTAEGAGRISPRDKASFYVRARGSTTESAAVIDVCLCLKLIDEAQARQPKDMLDRIAQMLTKLIKAHQT